MAEELSVAALVISVTSLTHTGDAIATVVVTRAKTTDGRFKAGTVEAKRGLDEYLTLQEDLVAGHPDVIVPGLAALAVTDDDHLLRLELNRFLTRIAAIEQLRQDPIAVAFLQGEERPGGKKAKAVLQLGTLTVPMVPLQLKQFMDLIPQKGVPESDLFYEEQRGTVSRLDASYHNSTRAADRVRKAHSALLTALRDVAAKLQNTADLESAGDLKAPVHDLSSTLYKTLETLEKQNTSEYGNYALWLHSQSSTLHNSKLALANRIAASEKYDAACKNTRKKREASTKAKADKADKAQAELAEAEKQEADLKEAFFHISESLKSDFARVESERAADTRTAVTLISNSQLKLAKDIRGILEAHPRA